MNEVVVVDMAGLSRSADWCAKSKGTSLPIYPAPASGCCTREEHTAAVPSQLDIPRSGAIAVEEGHKKAGAVSISLQGKAEMPMSATGLGNAENEGDARVESSTRAFPDSLAPRRRKRRNTRECSNYKLATCTTAVQLQQAVQPEAWW